MKKGLVQFLDNQIFMIRSSRLYSISLEISSKSEVSTSDMVFFLIFLDNNDRILDEHIYLIHYIFRCRPLTPV
jgi:hypothetical protein